MAIARAVIKISDNFIVEYRTITASEALSKELTLSNTPKDVSKTRLTFPNGTQQIFGFDYTCVGDKLIWNGYSLETLIAENDVLAIEYFI